MLKIENTEVTDLDNYVKEWLERKYERNKDTYR